MRLSEKHRQVLESREAEGYVWLSHLTLRAQMRFRDRRKRGFSKFVKEDGLTFLTKEVAEYLETTSRPVKEPRIKMSEQVNTLEGELASAGDMMMILRKHMKMNEEGGVEVIGLDPGTEEYEKTKLFIEKGIY